MIFRDFQFGWASAWPLLFAVLFFLLLFGLLFRYRENIKNHLGSSSVLNSILVDRSQLLSWLKIASLCLAWVFSVLALMRPEGNAHYTHERRERLGVLQRQPHEVFLVLDASASMSVQDMRAGKSRLEAAKEIAGEMIGSLTGEMVSVYAITSELLPLVPPTLDYVFARLVVNNIQINEGGLAGSALVKSLEQLHQVLEKSPPSMLKSVFVFTDGEDTWGDKNQRLFSDGVALNTHFYLIGMGTKEGNEIPNLLYKGKPVRSALESDWLQAAGGKYYEANEYSPYLLAKELSANIFQNQTYASQHVEREVGVSEILYDLYFQFPLGLALVFLAIFLILPETKRHRR